MSLGKCMMPSPLLIPTFYLGNSTKFGILSIPASQRGWKGGFHRKEGSAYTTGATKIILRVEGDFQKISKVDKR